MIIYDNLNALIMESMKAHDKVKTETMKAIKTAFTVYKTSGANKEINDVVEIQILKKLHAQRIDAAEQYKAAGRQELADNELKEAAIIEVYLPKEMTEDEVKVIVKETIANLPENQKNMGVIMKTIRSQYSNIDGKMLSNIVKQNL